MIISCPVSLGELVDKISILKIKTTNISDTDKVALAQSEYDLLMEKLSELKLEGMNHFLDKLIGVNSELWKIEDDIRELEKQKVFEKEFIDLARAVYVTNDRRFAVKNEINEVYGSTVKEVKSYEEY